MQVPSLSQVEHGIINDPFKVWVPSWFYDDCYLVVCRRVLNLEVVGFEYIGTLFKVLQELNVGRHKHRFQAAP
jgi:hypothetical protein